MLFKARIDLNSTNLKWIFNFFHTTIFLQMIFYVLKYFQIPRQRVVDRLIVRLCTRRLDKLGSSSQAKLIEMVIYDLKVSILVQLLFFKITIVIMFAYIYLPVFNFIFFNGVLQGRFATLGLDWLAFLVGQSQTDPLVLAFPPQGTCFYSTCQSYLKESVNCFLPFNIYIAKVLLIVWFWFVFVIIACIWFVLETIIYHKCPGWRLQHMQLIAPIIRDEPSLQNLIKNDVQCWHTLFLYSKNLSAKEFQILMNLLADYSKVNNLDKEIEKERENFAQRKISFAMNLRILFVYKYCFPYLFKLFSLFPSHKGDAHEHLNAFKATHLHSMK